MTESEKKFWEIMRATGEQQISRRNMGENNKKSKSGRKKRQVGSKQPQKDSSIINPPSPLSASTVISSSPTLLQLSLTNPNCFPRVF